MKQVIIKNSIIKSVFSTKTLNNYLNIIIEIRPLTFGFVLATVLCNYQQAFCAERSSEAIAQIPNPNSFPPDRLEDIPVNPLPSDVLPQPSEQDRLLPPQLPETQTPGQDEIDAKFQVERIEVVGSTIFKPEDFVDITSVNYSNASTLNNMLSVFTV